MESRLTIAPQAVAQLESGINSKKEIFCSGLYLSARWFVLSQAAKKALNFIILPDQESAEYCCADLYSLESTDNVFFLPHSGKGLERSNYKSSLSVQRTSAISEILKGGKERRFVVSYPAALQEKIPSRKTIKGSVLKLAKGDEINFETIISVLGNAGFERVDFVSAPGQFSVRGSLIDIFSYANNEPYRVSFWGDEIEEIHTFNCNTQISDSSVESVEIVSDLLASPDEGGENIVKLLPESTLVWLDSSDVYKEEEFFTLLDGYGKVYLEVPLERRGVETVNFKISPQPVFNKNYELLAADIREKTEKGLHISIFCEKDSQIERLRSAIATEIGIIPDFIKGKNIHSGFIDADSGKCFYTDHEIFDRFHRVAMRRSVEKTEQLTVNELNSFNIGDYIVHIDHGIGIFGGLVKMYDDNGKAREVVKINYRDGDVIFVSVHSLNKISRFRSADGEPPKINKLGSKTWATLKANAKRKVKDIAKELIQLYAKRRSTKGFAFSADTYLQDELESSFMYEDTPDQELATKMVKQDMEDSCPMDRLVCGDVGFGKTEVAIRAAFKAVCDGKQVAVLVPTTILALQHFNTFKARLENLPCKVDYVSRLRTAKEISQIKSDLAAGRTDILIGTHKILGAGFEFKDLGLLIIDEEQKFGVSAKEKLRQIKADVDTLTLTATPIPRTLQFSLLGARDLSIINTPPPNRIPVQTEIMVFDEKELHGIVEYELKRGGQLFFLHNKVEELPSVYDILHRVAPDARICVAHGKLPAQQMEDRMLGFIRGEYDIMLCTTIIENGLDIPNANTIIINQAQNIGLSDLHQLRGRVGRSNRKAFCYLIVPPLTGITEEARRRLRAIEEFSDLGSGFNIAMQDLDIRGAGNLLGAEQSGFIMDMGYETYQKIINEAVEELGIESGVETRRSQLVFSRDCTIETSFQAYLPDEYVNIPAEKIRLYKQLDSMTSEKELDRLRMQLEDRFGPVPQEAANLFDVVKIRNLGASLGFEKIIIKNGMLICFFVGNTMSPYYKSDVFANLIQKVSEHPGDYALRQTEKLKIVSRGVENLSRAYALLAKLR